MSKIFDKSVTNSSNMNDMTIESEFNLNNFYSKITSIYNKKNNKQIFFNRRKSNPKKFQKINVLKNFSHDNMNYSKSTNQSEENKTKTKFNLKENKENQVNSIFNNSFIREKQKGFRFNSISMRNYHIYLNCDKKNNTFDIVDNNSKMYKAFLSKTKSNFNNKYNIIYSISNWKKKDQINKLFNSIKKYQNKFDFYSYLENKVNNRCFSAKRLQPKNNLTNIISSKNNNIGKILIENQSKDFMRNIFHKNNLIKIKTVDFMTNKLDIGKITKDKVFYSNNILFKTMPLKK
jgi:hypothetical protein